MPLRRCTNNARRPCTGCCAPRFRANIARTCIKRSSSRRGPNSIALMRASRFRPGSTALRATYCGNASANWRGAAPARSRSTNFRPLPRPEQAVPWAAQGVLEERALNKRCASCTRYRKPSVNCLAFASSKVSARRRSQNSSNRHLAACACACIVRCSACGGFAKRNKNEA